MHLSPKIRHTVIGNKINSPISHKKTNLIRKTAVRHTTDQQNSHYEILTGKSNLLLFFVYFPQTKKLLRAFKAL